MEVSELSSTEQEIHSMVKDLSLGVFWLLTMFMPALGLLKDICCETI